MKRELANDFDTDNAFFFDVGGSFTIGYQLSHFKFEDKGEDYTNSSSRGCWMIGGTGELNIGGKISKTMGCGAKIHFGFLGNLSNEIKSSYYLPITLHYYIERYFNFLATAGFVLRLHASMGLGGGGAWGSSVKLDNKDYSFETPAGLVVTGTCGIYFDFYFSKNAAFYFGPGMSIDAIILQEKSDKGSPTEKSLDETKGFFRPSFNIGIRCANFK